MITEFSWSCSLHRCQPPWSRRLTPMDTLTVMNVLTMSSLPGHAHWCTRHCIIKFGSENVWPRSPNTVYHSTISISTVHMCSLRHLTIIFYILDWFRDLVLSSFVIATYIHNDNDHETDEDECTNCGSCDIFLVHRPGFITRQRYVVCPWSEMS